MNEPSKSGRGWRIVRRILISLAILATLIAIFYTEEDWRGKHAWEQCKHELEAEGEVLDWNAYIPPPVPDDRNFFMAPKMQEWFVGTNNGRGSTELSRRLQSTNETLTASAGTKSLITTAKAAKNYLAWSDQFGPDFNLIREALNRPYARIDGDYTQPYTVPVPNFLTVRAVAQVLAQRAHCYLVLHQPEQALFELTLMHDMCHLLEGAPTGKPMTLVAAMINVAVIGLYVNTIAEGFQRHVWQEPELSVLQEQLKEINLLSIVKAAFQCSRAAETHTLETHPAVIASVFLKNPTETNFWRNIDNPKYLLSRVMPCGWVYQNMVVLAQSLENMLDSYDPANDLIFPSKADESADKARSLKKWSPYAFLADIAQPNFIRATQSLAYNQTLVNEAQIACALERYRLAHGEYPEILDVLVPQFIAKLPHDIIGGQPSQGFGSASQPLHYHRMADGKYLLYSVGWNEKDDGGTVALTKSGEVDMDQGDWVWKYPVK